MRRLAFQRRLRDEDGLAAVEFSMVALPLFMLILGAIDLGWQAYASSVVQGVLVQTARKAGLEGATMTALNSYADDQLSSFADASDVKLRVRNFREFSDVGKPERITTDTPPIGTYNPGDCYIDANNNGVYDNQQGDDGTGRAEDALQVTLSVKMSRFSPVAGLFGMNGDYTIERSTMVQSEPYAGVTDPPVRCS